MQKTSMLRLFVLSQAVFLFLFAVCAHGAAVSHRVVSGRVVGPDGAPVVGARVDIRRFRQDEGKAELTTVTSDGNGAWSAELEMLDHAVKPESVVAYKAGLAPAMQTLKSTGNVLTLSRGVSVGGEVHDGAGQPVEGVKVRMVGLRFDPRPLDPRPGTGSARYWSVKDVPEVGFSTRTGPDGHWTLPDLPPGSAVLWLEHERYATIGFTVEVADKDVEAPPAVLEPAAIIAGKVLYEDGRPAAGVEVYGFGADSKSQLFQPVQTDATGQYRLPGIAAGEIRVYATRTPDWVPPGPVVVNSKAGTTVQAPPLQLTAGALIEGSITDAQSAAPLAGIVVAAGAGYSSTRSDARGRYRLRVLPGKHGIYISSNLPEYLEPEQGARGTPVRVDVAKGEKKSVDFKLNKGLVQEGLVVDETDRPLEDVRLLLLPDDARPYLLSNNDSTDTSNAGGQWKIVGLKPGVHQLKVEDGWDILGPTKISVPHGPPFKVVLRRIPMLQAKGTVVTQHGQPVEGATVTAYVSSFTPHNISENDVRHLKSDANGQFLVDDVYANQRIMVHARKPGYYFASNGAPGYKEALQPIDNVVLMPMTAQVKGVVTNPAGAPLPGVRVLAVQQVNSETTTDAQGRFAFAGLVEGKVALVAAHQAGAANTMAQTGDDETKLMLRPSAHDGTPAAPNNAQDTQTRKKALAKTVLMEALQTSRNNNNRDRAQLALLLAENSPDAAIALMLQVDGNEPNGPTAENLRRLFIETLVEQAPLENVEWIVAQLPKSNDRDFQFRQSCELALAVATAKPDVTQTLYETAKQLAAVPQLKSGASEGLTLSLKQSSRRPFYLAAVAARLGRQEEFERWFQDGVVLLPEPRLEDKTPSLRDHRMRYVETRRDVLNWVARLAGRSSIGMVERVLQLFDRDELSERMMVSRMAIEPLARHDVAGALRLLNQMEDEGAQLSQAYFIQGILAIIDELGPRDPQAALALARRSGDSYLSAQALAKAALYQSPAQAVSLLCEAGRLSARRTNGYDELVQIAELAAPIDAAVSREILQIAEARLRERMAQDDGPVESWRRQFDFAGQIARFAAAISRFDPVESRLLIEAEFAYHTQWKSDSPIQVSMAPLVTAMAAIDPVRALEMVREIRGNPARSTQLIQSQALAELGRYLLGPDSARPGST